jgi:hypothetical protein
MSTDPESIRILMVHPVFRSGIAAFLATQPDMKLVADGFEWTGSDPAVSSAPPGHYPHALANARK